jgi:hypothetical protein
MMPMLEHPAITRTLATGYPEPYKPELDKPDEQDKIEVSEEEYGEIILKRHEAEKGQRT